MTKIIDKICKYRDIISSKDYTKLIFYKDKFSILTEDLRTQMKNKMANPKDYDLDFTSQDLRELAEDIDNLLKRFDYATDPKRNIKKIIKESKITNQINLTKFAEEVDKSISHSISNIFELYHLKLMASKFAVVLYFYEDYYKDEFATKYTERFN